jgi:hypothetical protein
MSSSNSTYRNFLFLKKIEEGGYKILGKRFSAKPPRWIVLSLGKYYLTGIFLLLIGVWLEKRDSILEMEFPIVFNIVMVNFIILSIWCMWKDVKAYDEI